ncbi:MAG: prephenate dehydrogenase [Bacteroidota bacterium]
MTIGLLGYGRFGRLVADLLAKRVNVVVWDPSRPRRTRPGKRVKWGTLEQVARQRIVLLAVPISTMRPVLRRIRPLVVPGSLVVDVCAVKSLPVRWMAAMLPPDISLLGTHPLFGPDSYSGTLRGHRIVLCPVRGPGRIVRDAKRLLAREGLTVEVMDPDDHDRMMADTVFLTQCVGRAVAAAGLAATPGGTVFYRQLRSMVDVARNDSEELFLDMWRFNRHARTVARRLGMGWNHLQHLLTSSSL